MMEEKVKKLMEKKKARKLSPVEKKAKMGVLSELKDDMSSEMGGSLKDMMAKKVSVMASNKEDLKKGLDKAKELVGHMPNGEDGQLEDMEAEESGEEGMAEAAEDVDSEIAKLEEKLAKLKKMKGESEEEESEDESEEA